MEPHPYGQALAARNLDGLVALLADDVVFHSPVINDPGFEGRDCVAALLAMVLDAISVDEFTHELGDERTRILVFNGRVLGKSIKTTTLLELNTDGKVREIWAMVRPLTGVVAIAEAIGSQLAERRGAGRGPTVRVLSKPLAGLAAVTDRIGAGLIAALNRSTA
jgi:hypothetical protein